MDIFKLFGSVLVETSGAERNLNNVDQQARGASTSIGEFIGKAKEWGGQVSDALSTVKSYADKLLGFIDEMATYGDQIDKESQRLGFTAREYQEWDHILQHYGTSLGEIGIQLGNLYADVAEKKESTMEALRTLGIDLNEAAAMTPADLFQTIVAQLQGVGDQGLRASLASTLFRAQADALNPVLNATAADLDACRSHLSEFNALMTDEQTAEYAAYKDAVSDWDLAWVGLKNSLAALVTPSVTILIQEATKQLSYLTAVLNGEMTLMESIKAAWADISGYWMSPERGTVVSSVARAYDYQLNEFTDLVSGDRSYGDIWSDWWNLFTTSWDNYWSDEPAGGRSGKFSAAPPSAADGGSTVINQYISSVPQTPAELSAATAAAFERARWIP